MAFKDAKKHPRGNKKSKDHIKKVHSDIFKLMCQGMSKSSILDYAVEKFKVSENTARRYWNNMVLKLDEKYDEEGAKELSTFRARAKKRMEEASRKYFKEGSPDWLKAWKDEEYSYIKMLQSIGLVDKVSDKLRLEGKVDFGVSKALEEIAEKEIKKQKETP